MCGDARRRVASPWWEALSDSLARAQRGGEAFALSLPHRRSFRRARRSRVPAVVQLDAKQARQALRSQRLRSARTGEPSQVARGRGFADQLGLVDLPQREEQIGLAI